MRLARLFHRDEAPQELPCPRCGTPAPTGIDECTVCGWDLRESYREADEPSDPRIA